MEMARLEEERRALVRRFWPPFAVATILTPFFWLIGFASAGAGHGNYFYAKLLFPFTMLSTMFSTGITAPFLIVGILQFPVYGVLLGFMNRKTALIPGLVGLATLHIGAAIMCLLLIGENFS
jgi:hypothetical protein